MQEETTVPLEELAASILSSRCPFQILQLGPNTTLAEVKGAYRRLCLVFHPDKSTLPAQLASEVFQALQGAYLTASQRIQPVQQPAAPKDLWAQFYAAPTAPTEAAPQAAAPAAPVGQPRPAQVNRQASLWGSSRGAVASAWGRAAVMPGHPLVVAAPVPAAASAAAAPAAAPAVGTRKRSDRVEHTVGAPPNAGCLSGGAAALPSLRLQRRRAHTAAPDLTPVEAEEPPRESPTAGGGMPANKRRCDAADSPEPQPAGLPGVVPMETLQRRRSAAWQQQHVRRCSGGWVAPGTAQATRSEDGGNTECGAGGGEDVETAQLPRAQRNASGQAAPGPNNVWGRRPIFAPNVLLAPYPPITGDGLHGLSGVCRESGDEGQLPLQQHRVGRRAAQLAGYSRQPHTRHQRAASQAHSDDYSADNVTSYDDSANSSKGTGGGSSPSPSNRDGATCSGGDSDGIWVVGGDKACGGSGATSAGGSARLASDAWQRHCSRSKRTAAGQRSADLAGAAPTLGCGVAAMAAAEAGPPGGALRRPLSSATGVVGSDVLSRLQRRQQPVLQALGAGVAGACTLPEQAASFLSPAPGAREGSRPDSLSAGPQAGVGAAAAPADVPRSRLDLSHEVVEQIVGDTLGGGSGACQGGPRRLARQQYQPDPSKDGNGVSEARLYMMHQQVPSKYPHPLRGGGVGDGGFASTAGPLPPLEHQQRRQFPQAGMSSDAAIATDSWLPGFGEDHMMRPELMTDDDREMNDGAASMNDGGGDGDGIARNDNVYGLYEEDYGGGEADPDDEWWSSEPCGLGAHSPPAAAVGDGAPRYHEQAACPPATRTGALEAFLQQVQRGGELQAQRAGQARISNLRRHAPFGRRGRGRGRGGGSSRGGAGCGKRSGGKGGRGGSDARGPRGGAASGMGILRYSRPVDK